MAATSHARRDSGEGIGDKQPISPGIGACILRGVWSGPVPACRKPRSYPIGCSPDCAAHPAPPPRDGARRAWPPPWCSLWSARSAGAAAARAGCRWLNWHGERGQVPPPSAPAVAPAVRRHRAGSRPPCPQHGRHPARSRARRCAARPCGMGTPDHAGIRRHSPVARATRRWLRTVGCRAARGRSSARGSAVWLAGRDRGGLGSGLPSVGERASALR